MTSRDFCYWLQGIFEVIQPETLNSRQIAQIRAHLNMVFIHEIDPSFPEEQQEKLNVAHNEPEKLKPNTEYKPLRNYPPLMNDGMKC
jgi:phosphoenolpyruvate carboxylase